MSWDALGAVAEMLGAIGVIATLGYLSVQIRQNTASVRASTLQNMSEASASWHDFLASDADLARIFLTGMNGLEDLTPEERLRFQFLMMAFLRRVENFQRQDRQGRIAAEDWAGLCASCLSIMSQPGSRAWWAENAERFNPDFGEWLRREL